MQSKPKVAFPGYHTYINPRGLDHGCGTNYPLSQYVSLVQGNPMEFPTLYFSPCLGEEKWASSCRYRLCFWANFVQLFNANTLKFELNLVSGGWLNSFLQTVHASSVLYVSSSFDFLWVRKSDCSRLREDDRKKKLENERLPGTVSMLSSDSVHSWGMKKM